jgi:hypothetical protein
MIDDEGTEDGGLIFSGGLIDGKPVTAGHLSFDQYDQDQTVSLSRSEENGTTSSDLVLSDQPAWRLTPEIVNDFMRVKSMPEGPARQTAWADLLRRYPAGHARAILRRAEDGTASLCSMTHRASHGFACGSPQPVMLPSNSWTATATRPGPSGSREQGTTGYILHRNPEKPAW